MSVIKIEIELSAEQEKLFGEYLDVHCLDRDKWLKRMAYNFLCQAVGKWQQPRGVVNAAFNKKTEVRRGSGKRK